jgi:hypothetical protein
MPDQQSKMLKDTQNPRWSDYDMKDISIYYNNPVRLQQSVLQIEILTKNNLNQNIVLAYGSIPLNQIKLIDLAAQNKGRNVSCDFHCPLTYAGMYAGAFRCQMTFQWTYWHEKSIE